MTDQEKMDVILRNEDMRTEAGQILHDQFAREIMPFMNGYRNFVNAKTDMARGEAFAAIFKDHLQKGAELELNLLEPQMNGLRQFGLSPGPIPANSPLVELLGDAAVQVKITMAGSLKVQGRTDPLYDRAHRLLDLAAQPPAPLGSGRASLSGTLKSFFTRGFTQSSPKKDGTPSSSSSSSSSGGQASQSHRISGVGSSSSKGVSGRSLSGVYGSGGTTPAKIAYTPRDIIWDRPRVNVLLTNTLLNKCLANAEVRTLFGEFLATQRSLEGLLFLESCAIFFQAPTLEQFKSLTATYVQPEAENQINISMPAKLALDGAQSLDEARAALAMAETDVYKLMKEDSLRNFQNDPAFLGFLATPEGARLFPELLT